VVQATPTSTANFDRVRTDEVGSTTKSDVKLVAGDTTTTFPVTWTGTPTGAEVRDAIYASIPKPTNGKNGWVVESLDGPLGPRIRVSGYLDANGNTVPLKTATYTPDKGRGPTNITTSGVNVGQLTTGTPWDIALLPNPSDGSAAVPVDSTLALTLNSTAINVNLHQGESLTQAVADIFQALQNAGVTDAAMVGNDVTFLHDQTGNEITSVSRSLTPVSSGQPCLNSWFELDVNIAQRMIQS
jgi:hypothetical protein